MKKKYGPRSNKERGIGQNRVHKDSNSYKVLKALKGGPKRAKDLGWKDSVYDMKRAKAVKQDKPRGEYKLTSKGKKMLSEPMKKHWRSRKYY